MLRTFLVVLLIITLTACGEGATNTADSPSSDVLTAEEKRAAVMARQEEKTEKDSEESPVFEEIQEERELVYVDNLSEIADKSEEGLWVLFESNNVQIVAEDAKVEETWVSEDNNLFGKFKVGDDLYEALKVIGEPQETYAAEGGLPMYAFTYNTDYVNQKTYTILIVVSWDTNEILKIGYEAL